MRKSVILVGALLLGCGSNEDPTDGTSSSTAAGYGSGGCDTCDAMACADERSTCASEPDCAAYLDCVGKCAVGADGDAETSCESSCRTGVTSPSGEAALQLLDSCRRSGAGSTCTACGRSGEGGAGGQGTCTTPDVVTTQQCAPDTTMGDTACETCQKEHCCDSLDQVLGTGPAGKLADCWLACDDTACENACFDQYPDGVAGFAGYQACISLECLGTGLCAQSPTHQCGLCQYDERCGCEYARCITNDDCFAITRCGDACAGNVTCAKECQDQFPDGKPLAQAFQLCLAQRCPDDCTQ